MDLEEQHWKISLRERIEAMLAASAIADAMAGPFEGRDTEKSRRFLKEGGWIDDFSVYPAAYQHYWNVYSRHAKAGTFTDDTRLRLLVCQAMIENSKKSASDFLTRKALAQFIFDEYQEARISYEKQVQDNSIKFLEQPVSLREKFLHLWFMWEITKTATSVFVPQKPKLLSPPAERNAVREYTSEPWFCKPVKPYTVKTDLKSQFNNSSYDRGEVLPLGLITLPPLSVFFPGDPRGCFKFVREIDFFDIGEAPIYAATAAAILSDLLGGKSWPELILEIQEFGLEFYLGAEKTHELSDLDQKIITAIMLSHRFRSRETEANKENFAPFASALYDRFAVGEEIMCTIGEMLPVALAIMDYSPQDLKWLIEFGVNYGRDNDTVASLAALFGGAAYGMKTIPQKWMEVVSRANRVDFHELAEGLSRISTDKRVEFSSDVF
ncbi:MAG: ADP-ribosylglycohydrolase family protein [Calditrichaeota bacterium]|nr:ADP-ribosylglycohydrolase family protein [Calditrichota bacterium]